MHSLQNIIYPPQFQDENSRTGKTFKFFKIEPIEIPKKIEADELKTVNLGEPSGRIDYVSASQDPYLENIYDQFEILSFADIISECLEEHRENSNI